MPEFVEVPEEAVEAAAKSEWVRFGSHNPSATWETEDPEYKEHLRTGMRLALEAARPFMHRVVTNEAGLLPGTVVQDKTGDVLKLMPNGEWWATDAEFESFVEYPAKVLVEGTNPRVLIA